MVFLFVFRRPVFDEPIDGVVYAVPRPSGSRRFENFVYLFAAYSETLVLPLRALAAAGGPLGPGPRPDVVDVGLRTRPEPGAPHPLARRLIWHGLLLAIVLHSAFNFLVGAGAVGATILILVLVPGMWLLATRRITASLRESAPPG